RQARTDDRRLRASENLQRPNGRAQPGGIFVVSTPQGAPPARLLAVGISAGDQVVLGEAGGATDSCRVRPGNRRYPLLAYLPVVTGSSSNRSHTTVGSASEKIAARLHTGALDPLGR